MSAPSAFPRRTLLAATASSGFAGIAGCLGDTSDDNPDRSSESFVLAAAVRDDPDAVGREYEPLADWIQSATGTQTRIDPVQDDGAAVAALAAGQADAAHLSGGPSWVGWQRYDLEVLAVETDEEGRTHYVAGAWIRADSSIERVADLEGRDSCHTGDLAGAGMLIPTAHLAKEGLVSFEETDDVTAIRGAVDEFFGDPLVGGGYVGALQCLSEGHGEVAFVRRSTPDDYCGGPDPEPWCLDLDEYELLIGFAEVPSHTVMFGAEIAPPDRERLREAVLSLNDDQAGRQILTDVLAVHRLEPATASEHLGPYGELLENLPGIEDHLLE